MVHIASQVRFAAHREGAFIEALDLPGLVLAGPALGDRNLEIGCAVRRDRVTRTTFQPPYT
jgi:hypothetical protein